MADQPLRAILAQLRDAAAMELWYPAISTSLLVPDLCGAIEFPTARPRDRWANWYDEWVAPRYACRFISGAIMYRFRNALIHEATGFARGIEGFDRIVFFGRGSPVLFDRCSLRVVDEEILTLSIANFLNAIIAAAHAWQTKLLDDKDEARLSRLGQLALYRRTGQGVFEGLPIISQARRVGGTLRRGRVAAAEKRGF